MLQSNRRHVLFFDLAMAPYPSDAPIIPLAELIPYLKAQVDKAECVQVIDADRRVVRLSSLEIVDLPEGRPGVAMLFNLGDREKADPGFTDLQTGAVRIVKRRRGEGGGLSVHAVVSLEPPVPEGHLFRLVYEDVVGFGRSILQDFLRAQFKAICEDRGSTFAREGKREIKTRPMVTLNGHASDQLRNSLQEGRLLHVELIDYVKADFGLDEGEFVKSVRRDLSFSVSKALPHGEALGFVERMKAWAKSNGYEKMRVRWKEPDVKRPLTASVDTARQDAGDVFFVRSVELTLDDGLADVSESPSNELVRKMCKLLA